MLHVKNIRIDYTCHIGNNFFMQIGLRSMKAVIQFTANNEIWSKKNVTKIAISKKLIGIIEFCKLLIKAYPKFYTYQHENPL